MSIKESIIYYINLYGGSEQRIVDNTASDHVQEYKNVKEAKAAVGKNIAWLLKKGYIANVTSLKKKTDDENRYYNSDHCEIYRIIKKFKEDEYAKECREQAEYEEQLSDPDRFWLYLEKMQDESEAQNPFAEKAYDIKKDKHQIVRISQKNESDPWIIDLNLVTESFYDEHINCIYYRYENIQYVIEQYYEWGKINIKKYKPC